MRSSIGGSSPPACHTTKDAIQTIALKKTIADKDKQIILLERKLATAELSIKTLQENEVKTKMTERSVRFIHLSILLDLVNDLSDGCMLQSTTVGESISCKEDFDPADASHRAGVEDDCTGEKSLAHQ